MGMRKIIIILIISLGISIPVFAEAYFSGKTEMIAKSDIIVIVDIKEIKALEQNPAYREQEAKAYTIKKLKGNPAAEFTFFVPSMFPCAITSVEKGRYIVFLMKVNDSIERSATAADGGFSPNSSLEGSNWHYSYRPIKEDKVEWLDNNTISDLKEISLEKAISDINKIIIEHEKLEHIVKNICIAILKIKDKYTEMKGFTMQNYKGLWMSYGSCPPVDDVWISLHFKNTYWHQLPCRYNPDVDIYIKEVDDHLLFSAKIADELLKENLIQVVRENCQK